MGKDPVKVTEEIISCSGNGQHPLIYINLHNGSGRCQYCGQQFIYCDTSAGQKKAAHG